MTKNKYMRLIMDIIVFAMGTVLTKLVQFLLMPLYTSYMSTEAYGVAELINNMSELLYPIVTLCIYEAVFRFAIGSQYSNLEIITAGMRVLLISALITACLVFTTRFFIKFNYVDYLYLILFSYSFRMLLAYYIRGRGYTKLFAFSGIMNAVFLALFSYFFLVTLKLNVKGYLLSSAFSNLFTMLFLCIGANIYRELDFKISTKVVTAELLKYSTPLILYNIGYWLTTMSGRYILLLKTDASTVGEYAAVMKLSSVINMVQQAFYAAIQLNTSREYNAMDKEIYYNNIYKYYSAGILLFGSIILCFSPVLADFTLKKDFFASRVYLPLILFTAIVDCLFCFYKTMYTTYKLTKSTVPSMMIGAFINVLVCLLTVEQMGIWGICAASLLCYLFQAGYRIWDVRKFVRIRTNWNVILPGIIILALQVIIMTYSNREKHYLPVMLAIVLCIYICLSYRKDIMEKLSDLQLSRGQDE